MVRDALTKNNLRIEPDIHAAGLDGEIEFHVGSEEFGWLPARIRSDLIATRVADWFDQNPTATKSEIAAKVEGLQQLEISDLSSDEAEDIARILKLHAEQIEDAPWEERRLEQIAAKLKGSKTSEPIKVRQLLRWFGTERRSLLTTYVIRQALLYNNVRSEPSFDRAPIDGTIQFQTGYECDELDAAIMNRIWLNLVGDRLSAWCDLHPGFTESELRAKAEALQNLEWEELAAEESGEIVPFPVRGRCRSFPFSGSPDVRQDFPTKIATQETALSVDRKNISVVADPAVRIGGLPSASIPPRFLRPNQTVIEAMTILMQPNIQWIPVMIGERDVKCVVSWRWIGMRLAQGANPLELQVRECKDKPQIADADTPLSDATDQIKKHGYVLVRDSTQRISGIVTEGELIEQAREFFLLKEIESRIRGIIERARFSERELRVARDPSDAARPVKSASDLTFGEYIRLLEQREYWQRLRLSIDRKMFIKDLEKIKDIRNDVLHFRGIGKEQLDALRTFVTFLQGLEPMMGP
jgi:hypothetical protein